MELAPFFVHRTGLQLTQPHDQGINSQFLEWTIGYKKMYMCHPDVSPVHVWAAALYIYVVIMDQFLQVQSVSPKKLQLVGIMALFLASKHEETFSPNSEAFISQTIYTLVSKSKKWTLILKEIKCELGWTLPLPFLRWASKARKGEVGEQHTLANIWWC